MNAQAWVSRFKKLRAVGLYGRYVPVPDSVRFTTYGDFRTWAVEAFGFLGPPEDYSIEIHLVAGRLNSIQHVTCHAQNTFPCPPIIFLNSEYSTYIFEMVYDGEGQYARTKSCCAVQ